MSLFPEYCHHSLSLFFIVFLMSQLSGIPDVIEN